jgi:hypothetical protein
MDRALAQRIANEIRSGLENAVTDAARINR